MEYIFERKLDGKYFSGECVITNSGIEFDNDTETTEIMEVFKSTKIVETWE